MTREELKLADRLVRSSAWRWMPGMLDAANRRVTALIPIPLGFDKYWLECVGLDAQGEDTLLHLGVEDMELPDLSDAATVGCLIHLVCEISSAELHGIVEGLERQGLRRCLSDISANDDYS